PKHNLIISLIDKDLQVKDITRQADVCTHTVYKIKKQYKAQAGQLCTVATKDLAPRDKINTLKGKLAAIEQEIGDSLTVLSGNIKPDELTGMKAIDAMTKLLAALSSIKELQGEAQTQSAFRMVFHVAAQLDDIRGVDPAQFLKAAPISDISQQ
ncbi:MAG: hypothetical protein D4S01_03970, partial [Dehalococcoidia bacterium]